ncbi:MAG: hypothetical protein ACAH80_13190 [Alphaproteobacteria bacterium]
MSDSKIPPAPKAPSILSATPVQGQKAADSPVSPLSMLKDLPVRQAPSGLERPQKRERETGHIVSYDRKTHEMRIATPRGMVTVKTEHPLPPGEDVVVELYVEKGVTLATITLLREEQATAEELQKIIPPPAPAQPLKAGDTAVAILIAEDAPDTASTAPKPTLQQAAQVLEQLQYADIQRLPQPLPLPPNIIMKLATAPDLFKALQSVPPAQQQAVQDYLARPEVITALPAPAARVLLQQPPAVPPTAPGDAAPLEAELILRTSPTPPPVRTEGTGTPAPTPAAPTPQQALAALKGLLDTQQAAALPFSGLMRMMVAGAMQTPQASPFAAMMPQNMYQIKIISVTPPNQPAPPPPAGPTVPIQGEVESITENGFPVIRAGESRYILKLPSTVEVGSTVLFDAIPLTSTQAMSAMQGAIPSAPTGPGFGGFGGFGWPAMDETLEALPAYSPTGQALRNSLPTPTPRMVPTALFFLAALRMGAVESWLGNTLLDTLRQTGKTGLADRLTGDFAKLSAQAKEPVSGEWRMIQMPMLHDEQLSQMQFFLRRQQDESGEEKEGAKPSTRFVLNLHLSRMGDLQLDGLMRQKRFDLIFRSGEALPLNMRQEMMQGFAKGLDQSGMQGGISFQTRAQNWVTVELPHKGTLA